MNCKELKIMRIRAGYSCEQAADKLGFSPATYRNKEAGRTSFSLEDSIQVADLYKMTVTDYIRVFLDNHIFSYMLNK